MKIYELNKVQFYQVLNESVQSKKIIFKDFWESINLETYNLLSKFFYIILKNGDSYLVCSCAVRTIPYLKKILYSFPYSGYSKTIKINNLSATNVNEYKFVNKLRESIVFETECDSDEGDFVYHSLDLKQLKLSKEYDISDQILNYLGGKQRNQIRKSFNYNFDIIEIENFTPHLYDLYLNSMKSLGMFSHPIEYFINFKKFNETSKLFTVKFNKDIIGFFIISIHDKILYLHNLVVPNKYKKLNVTSYIFYRIIKFGGDNELNFIEYGRSLKHSGSSNFKKNFSNHFYTTRRYTILGDSLVSSPIAKELKILTLTKFVFKLMPTNIFRKLSFFRKYVP